MTGRLKPGRRLTRVGALIVFGGPLTLIRPKAPRAVKAGEFAIVELAAGFWMKDAAKGQACPFCIEAPALAVPGDGKKHRAGELVSVGSNGTLSFAGAGDGRNAGRNEPGAIGVVSRDARAGDARIQLVWGYR